MDPPREDLGDWTTVRSPREDGRPPPGGAAPSGAPIAPPRAPAPSSAAARLQARLASRGRGAAAPAVLANAAPLGSGTAPAPPGATPTAPPGAGRRGPLAPPAAAAPQGGPEHSAAPAAALQRVREPAALARGAVAGPQPAAAPGPPTRSLPAAQAAGAAPVTNRGFPPGAPVQGAHRGAPAPPGAAARSGAAAGRAAPVLAAQPARAGPGQSALSTGSASAAAARAAAGEGAAAAAAPAPANRPAAPAAPPKPEPRCCLAARQPGLPPQSRARALPVAERRRRPRSLPDKAPLLPLQQSGQASSSVPELHQQRLKCPKAARQRARPLRLRSHAPQWTRLRWSRRSVHPLQHRGPALRSQRGAGAASCQQQCRAPCAMCAS